MTQRQIQTPTPCGCFNDPKLKTFPMGATSRYLLDLVREDGPKAVGGPKAVAMIKANPEATWCIGCGGIRAKNAEKERHRPRSNASCYRCGWRGDSRDAARAAETLRRAAEHYVCPSCEGGACIELLDEDEEARP